MLEEGSMNEPMEYFQQHGIKPNIQYIFHDDYTIMAMIEKGLVGDSFRLNFKQGGLPKML